MARRIKSARTASTIGSPKKAFLKGRSFRLMAMAETEHKIGKRATKIKRRIVRMLVVEPGASNSMKDKKGTGSVNRPITP